MFIRYPGSKAKICKPLLRTFPPELIFGTEARYPLKCYCEPFFGSGAIAWSFFNLLRKDTPVLINDRDPGIASLWRAVRDVPEELIRRVSAFRPSAEAFYEYKASDGEESDDPVSQGFRKLALHQLSFSGLGFMSGGPLGGKHGRSEYNPECRWNAVRIVSKIWKCHRWTKTFPRFDILSQDFEAVLQRLPEDSFAYLDPPYYVQGANLYKFAFDDADHQRLAGYLRTASFRWVLSYDDHPTVRGLYSWARIASFDMTPTTGRATEKSLDSGVLTKKRRKNSEIVITNMV